MYSLGIVAYEVLTGRVPFRGETPISTILKHIHDPPPLDGPPAEKVPKSVRDVLRKALAKGVDERYPSAGAFAEALRDARGPSRRQQPLSTESLEATTLIKPSDGRGTRRWLWIGLPVVAALVAGMAGLWALRPGPAPTATPSPPLPGPPPVSPSPLLPAPPRAETIAPPAPTPAIPGPSPRLTPSPRPMAVAPRPTATPAPTPVPIPTPTPAPPVVTGSGMLQIGVRPWAQVTVDGREMGTTPLDRIPLGAGRHVVRLEHPAYQPVEREVLVVAGETARLVFDFSSQGVPRR